MGEHALLAASASSRWLVCTRAPRLELEFADSESDYAREGTLAHAICEELLRHESEKLTKPILNKALREHADLKHFYNAEMKRYCEDYANYVLDRVTPESKLIVEHKLDTSSHIPKGFGTMDAGIITRQKANIFERKLGKASKEYTLETFDLKYGKGVPVFAEDNKQAMIYAIGVLNDYGWIYDITHVRMHIYQPRINNITEWDISIADLLAWGETVLKPKARLAFDGEGEFVPGNHCGFCKAKPTCRALAQYNLELAAQEFENYSELKEPVTLTDSELLTIYENRKLFEGWIKAIDEYVLKQALLGKQWKGYKTVEGKSNRQYRSIPILKRALARHGITDIYKPPEILGLGDMEIVVGKEIFSKVVAPLLTKPKGKPTLVPETDNRQVFNSALTDFTNLDE
jgi:hypothetical protein